MLKPTKTCRNPLQAWQSRGLAEYRPISVLVKEGSRAEGKGRAEPYRCVPPERGLVREGSPARVAHEGLLPGVYAVVPLQGIELGELLPALVTAVGPLAWKRSTAAGVTQGWWCCSPVTSRSPCLHQRYREHLWETPRCLQDSHRRFGFDTQICAATETTTTSDLSTPLATKHPVPE